MMVKYSTEAQRSTLAPEEELARLNVIERSVAWKATSKMIRLIDILFLLQTIKEEKVLHQFFH